MPVNKYALIRYRVIDQKIRNKYKPYPNMEELIEACSEALGKEISKSAIEKDIQSMKEDGSLGYYAPIKYSRRYKGYYYEDDNYTIDKLPLSEEDAEAIKFATLTLSQFKNSPVFKQYASAIDKIADRINLSENIQDRAIDQFVEFETLPTIRGNEFLEKILDAAKRSKKLNFHYQSYKGSKGKQRTVHPYLLKEYSNRWYLIGFSEEKQFVIVYALDRIEHLQITDESFERDRQFNAVEYFQYSVGITATGKQKPLNIILKANKVLAKYLISQPIHWTQEIVDETDDFVRFKFSIIQSYELMEKILSFGAEAIVEEPQELKEELLKQVQKMILHYNEK